MFLDIHLNLSAQNTGQFLNTQLGVNQYMGIMVCQRFHMSHEHLLLVREVLAKLLVTWVNALVVDSLYQKSMILGSGRAGQSIKQCPKLVMEGSVIAPLDRQVEVIMVQCLPQLAEERGYHSTWNI